MWTYRIVVTTLLNTVVGVVRKDTDIEAMCNLEHADYSIQAVLKQQSSKITVMSGDTGVGSLTGECLRDHRQMRQFLS